jgi:hypothetical protein
VRGGVKLRRDAHGCGRRQIEARQRRRGAHRCGRRAHAEAALLGSGGDGDGRKRLALTKGSGGGGVVRACSSKAGRVCVYVRRREVAAAARRGSRSRRSKVGSLRAGGREAARARRSSGVDGGGSSCCARRAVCTDIARAKQARRGSRRARVDERLCGRRKSYMRARGCSGSCAAVQQGCTQGPDVFFPKAASSTPSPMVGSRRVQ